MSAVASTAPLENVHKMNINRKPKSDKEIRYQVEAGRQLTKARMKKDFEVDQLAEELKRVYVGDVGFNRTSLYKHERGDRTLTPYRLMCIANVLDVPISELFDKSARQREVTKLHSKSELRAPYNLKKVSAGDALITDSGDISGLLNGFYVYYLPDGTLKLCLITLSQDNSQYAVESDEGIGVYAIDELHNKISQLKYFKRVSFIISNVTA